MIYSLFIINKSGGLIYQHDLNDGLNRLSANEHLILAGTVHGVFAIASKLTPTALKVSQPQQSQGTAVNGNTSGLKNIETDVFSMFIFQTLTGVKFLLVTSPTQGDLNRGVDAAENVLRKVYALYSDYVMKNPFYETDMPIRVDLFDRKITELVRSL
jgi:hypothetical protein